MLSRDHAEHAGGDVSKSEDEEVGVSEPSVSASSELITPEVEKLLPKAAHRVSNPSTAAPYMHESQRSGPGYAHHSALNNYKLQTAL